MHYRVNLRDLPNGSVEATCPDIPAFFTVQPSRPEALDFVRENLASALQTYRKKHEPIPVTSDRSATCLVYLPVRVQPENRGIYTQSDSSKKSSRNSWSLPVVSVDQRY